VIRAWVVFFVVTPLPVNTYCLRDNSPKKEPIINYSSMKIPLIMGGGEYPSPISDSI